MDFPTISAKEAKASLSKKSPAPKKSAKKAMESPYEHIRPICTNTTELERLMKRLLAPAKRRSHNIPWSEFKKLTKDERIHAKQELRRRDNQENLRDQVVFGMNEMITAIEEHTLSSAVVCEDMVPTFMMNFLLEFATIHHAPIIILPKLKDLTLEILGFPCSCFGLKRCASSNPNSHFYPLSKKIVEIAKEIGLPEKIGLYRCPKEEPLESQDVKPTADGQKWLQPDEEALGEGTALEANSPWPCMNPNSKAYWKSKTIKLEKEESPQPDKQLEGKEFPAWIGDELLQSVKGKERNSATDAIASTSRVTTRSQSLMKSSGAHPYLRTFITRHPPKGRKRKRTRSTAKSVEADNKGEQCEVVVVEPLNTKDDGTASGVGSEEAPNMAGKESRASRYMRRCGKKKEQSTVDHYKPLKLTDG